MEIITNKNYKDKYILVNLIKNTINIKQNNNIIQKNMITIIGMDLIGNRQIIGLSIEKETDNHYYLDLFEEIKSKGVNHIYFVQTENDIKIKKAIKISYPNTIWIDSFTMNLAKMWKLYSFKGRGTLISKIKKIYVDDTLDGANNYYQILSQTYNDNKLLLMIIDKYLSNYKDYYIYNKNVRLFLFNHNSFTDIYDKIKIISNNKVNDNIQDFINSIQDYLLKIENNRLYTKKSWTDIINNCGLYFNTLIEEVGNEI